MIVSDEIMVSLPEHMAELAWENNRCWGEALATDMGHRTTTPIIQPNGSKSYRLLSKKFLLWDRKSDITYVCEYFYNEKVLEFFVDNKRKV